jgi:hypothetical protein
MYIGLSKDPYAWMVLIWAGINLTAIMAVETEKVLDGK